MGKSRTHSALKTPLNEIFGSKANISVLRLLARVEGLLNHGDIIDRTSLSRQGVYNAVQRLIETGIVKYMGSGNKQLLSLRMDHPLAPDIKDLFIAEQERYKELIKALKKAIEQLQRKPEAAWIFGYVANGKDEYGDPLEIAVLSKLKEVDEITEQLRHQLRESEVEKKFDAVIDLMPLTKADLDTRPELLEQKLEPLWGPHPWQMLTQEGGSGPDKKAPTHQDLDREAQGAALAWAELLRRHPEIISRTVAYLEEQINRNSTGEIKEWREWKHILETMSHQQLKKFLESDTDRAVRLRQSLPFWPVLTEEERDELADLRANK